MPLPSAEAPAKYSYKITNCHCYACTLINWKNKSKHIFISGSSIFQSIVDLIIGNYTVHSPLFFRVIVEIERVLSLMAAI